MSAAASPRRGTRALVAALAALAVLVSPAIAGASPALATDAAAGEAAADAAAAGATFVVAPEAPVLADDADEYRFGVLLRNTGEETFPAGHVQLQLDPGLVASEEALDEGAANGGVPSAGVEIAEVEIGAVGGGKEQRITVSVPRSEVPLAAASAPGVRLVHARFLPDEEAPGLAELTASTAIVWRGVEAGRVPLSTIVPILLPSSVHTLPTRSQLSEAVPKWEGLLDGAASLRATLAIDPRIVAGIRAYGEEAPEGARRFLERLETSPLPSFLLQFADADPAAQADLGFDELLQPTDLDFVTRHGSFPAAEGSESADPVDPDPSGEPAPNPSAPGLDELLAWEGGSATAWPAEGGADEDTLELLRAAGLTTSVLDSENVAATGGPRVRLPGVSALVTDHALGTAAGIALSGATETERGAGFAALAARLAVAASPHASGMILGLSRGAVADAEDPALLLEQLAGLPWVADTPVADQETGAGTLVPPNPGDVEEVRLELLNAAVGREASVNELGPVLVHPEYLSGYQRTRLLDLFATRGADDEDFEAVADRYRGRDAELLDGVQALTTEHTQLVGSSTRVPLQVRNALPFDALVTVDVAPASAVVSIDERRFPEVLVPAESIERVLVPVRSRVSSGDSGLVITVSAAAGEPTVYTGTLAITVQSAVETIALWILGVLAALLLGIGIWRSVRRRMREQRAE